MCNPYLAPIATSERAFPARRFWCWMPVLALAVVNGIFWSIGPLLDGLTFLVYAHAMVSASTARKIDALLSLVI